MNYFDYAIVLFYIAILLYMGFALRQQQNKDDYFLGGRSLGWKSLSLSVMATQLSAISFVSAPAFVGLREGGGMQWLSYELAVPLAMLVLLLTVMPALYRSGVVSIYDFLERRFSLSTRLIISVMFQFSRAFATGIMVYAVAIILQGTMGVTVWQAIVITGVFTLLYSLQGGMKAVVYGDVIQMVIIVLGTVICLGFALHNLGGWQGFTQHVDPTRLQAVNFSNFGFSGDEFGFWPMIFGGIVLYASYYGCDQTQAQRALSAKDDKQLSQLLLVNGLARFPITLLYCFSGLFIGTLVTVDPAFSSQLADKTPDWMMPVFILSYLPHGIIGLLVVAILAAAMSSLSSTINSLAAVTLEDYCRLTGSTPDEAKYLSYAKWIGAFWGIVVLLLSLFADNIAATVIEAINKIGAVFYGPILALFILAVMAKKVGATAVNVGLIGGVLVNLILWQGFEQVFWFWWNFIGFAVCILLAVVSSNIFSAEGANTDSETPVVASDTGSMLTRGHIVILLGMFVLMIAICLSIPVLLG